MPTASQYARYRADRTTIWVSKSAAAFLARERTQPTEGTSAVLDRLIAELRRHRRAGGTGGAAATGAGAGAKRAAKTAGKTTAKRGATTTKRAGARRGTAAKGGARR